MSSMFNKQTQFAGAFKAHDMVLTFAGLGAGYLITGVRAGFKVENTRIRELGSNRTYYVVGDHQGTLNLTRVTGPSSSINKLIAAYSDACSIPSNVIVLSFAPGRCPGISAVDKDTGVEFHGVLFSEWGMDANTGNQLVVSTTLGGTFETLCDGTGTSVSDSLSSQIGGRGLSSTATAAGF